jgi:hypothetical protein
MTTPAGAAGFTAPAPDPGESAAPARPYGAGPPPGAEFRSNAFRTGANGDPGNSAGVSALNADSAAWMANVPRQFSQHSVLQTAMPSGIGLGITDRARMLPGSQPGQAVMLPTANGSSQQSYSAGLLMKLRGLDEV